MYSDAEKLAKACPECAVAMGTSRKKRPPLHPIPVLRPFQILGIDVMDLPVTEKGNRHVVVIQDLFTKWPLVFPVPDQKASRVAKLVVEEVVPLFGVPESLLSDRGTNLLPCLVLDVCKMLGITKLNTTAYHPQCDGAVERFNRTLKTILRKHAARFGNQWDTYLPGVLRAYRNTPHTSTGEKPSFLLFGLDCRSPTEAAFLPTADINLTDVCDYREELMLTLSSARELAARNIQRAQKRYKDQYDRRISTPDLRIGEWVLVRFPQDESGRLTKLSRPWHGPYRITRKEDPDVTVVKVYYHRYYSLGTGLETDHVSALYAYKLHVHSILWMRAWNFTFHLNRSEKGAIHQISRRRLEISLFGERRELFFATLLKVSTCTGREQRFGEGLNRTAASRQPLVVKSKPYRVFC